MTFAAPAALWLLVLVPALAALYVHVIRRPKPGVPRHPLVALIAVEPDWRRTVRRHFPAGLLLLALVAAVVGVARPEGSVTLPYRYTTIVLALDVSRSMRASDVEPTRISAAQAAARTFIENLPANVRVGLVSFSGTASVVQAPTTDKEALLAAIERLQLQFHTATGSGLYVALATLVPEAGIDLDTVLLPGGASRGASIDRAGKAPKARGTKEAPVPPGSYGGGAVILLSDGRRTIGPDPLDAARVAADLGVRVYTVGFGSPDGTTADMGGWSAYIRLDEETLQGVASVTRGEYYRATSGTDLKQVYEALTSKLVLEKRRIELTALWAGLAALLVAFAAALSFRWWPR